MTGATIYRVLNRFCEDGILHRIVAEDGKQYFAVCIKCDEKKLTDHHFHFRCTQCETIECLPNEVKVFLRKRLFSRKRQLYFDWNL
ncbi:Fur family transcriptional regulator [Chryseobacterium indoltheticum]|uniref:Fur family transcriptional regulator n=1 Tax=Chryseobacterium indoltheticum TaxID=254 RepID=UPI003F494B45